MIHDTKSQENLVIETEWKKRQSIDGSTKVTEILQLFDKDFKAAIINFFKEKLYPYSKQMKKKASTKKYKVPDRK